MTPIELITSWGIPISSSIAAVSAIRNHDPASGRVYTNELSESEMIDRIKQLTHRANIEPFETPKHTRIVYGYAISLAVRAIDTEQEGLPVSFDEIMSKTNKMIDQSPWSVKIWETETDGEPKLDAAGNPKKKKGAKKEMALKVYAENKDKNLSRQEWITLLMDEVGMTKAGASTYYANLKKGNL